MPQLTLGQIHERISEIDSTIFQAQTAQITLTDEDYRSLEIEVETLMQILAQVSHQNVGRLLLSVMPTARGLGMPIGSQ